MVVRIRCTRASQLVVSLLGLQLVFLSAFSYKEVFAQAPGSEEDVSLRELKELPLEELTKVEVTTSSKKPEPIPDTPGIMSVITAEEIELFGANTLPEVLERATGVQPIYSIFVANNAVPIRGDKPYVNDTHVLVLLNGIPLNRDSYAGYYNQAIYSSFPISAIERIEIIRGPGSVLYGTNAFSGVINIITRTKESRFTLNPVYGGFNTKALETSFRRDDPVSGLRINTALKYLNSDGWIFTANGLPATGTAAFSVPLSNRDNLGFTADLAYRDFTFTSFLGHSDQTNIRTTTVGTDGYLKNDKYFVAFGQRFHLSDDWKLNADFSHIAAYTDLLLRVNITDPYGPPTSTSYVRTNDSYLDLTLHGTLAKDMNLLVGTSVTLLNGRFNPVPSASNPGFSWSFPWLGVYTQLDYRFSPKFKAIIGGQLNKVPDNSANFVPRLGAIFNFTPTLGLKTLYAQAFRAPLPGETRIMSLQIKGNPSLRPELVKTFDIQLFFNHPRVESALTYYHSDQTNLITRVSMGQGKSQFENIGNIRIEGLELESKYLPNRKFYLFGSISFQNSRGENDTAGVTLAPNRIAKIGAGLTLPKISLGVFNSLISPYKDNSVLNPSRVHGNPDSGAYSLLTAKATYALKPQLKLSLYGTNLLDEKYFVPEFSTFTLNTIPGGPGRAIYAGLELNL